MVWMARLRDDVVDQVGERDGRMMRCFETAGNKGASGLSARGLEGMSGLSLADAQPGARLSGTGALPSTCIVNCIRLQQASRNPVTMRQKSRVRPSSSTCKHCPTLFNHFRLADLEPWLFSFSSSTTITVYSSSMLLWRLGS